MHLHQPSKFYMWKGLKKPTGKLRDVECFYSPLLQISVDFFNEIGYFGFLSDELTNYLLFTYEPAEVSKDLGRTWAYSATRL